jgi:hypothetical protein
VTRGRLDVHAHDTAVAGQPLRADADFVEAVFQELFHHGGAFVRVVGIDRAQDRLFRQSAL